MSTGTLRSKGAARRCSSMVWKPASISPNCSRPMASMSESPMAES